MIRNGCMIYCLCGAKLARCVSSTAGDSNRVLVFACEGCGHGMAVTMTMRDIGRNWRTAVSGKGAW